MTRSLGLVLSLAALKIAFGVAGYIFSAFGARPEAADAVPSGFRLSHLLVYGSVGLFLVLNRGRDRRAFFLGAAFLLVAVAPSDLLFGSLSQIRGLDGVVRILSHLHPDAFLPLCFWLFFSEFPRAPIEAIARFVRGVGVFLSAAGGTLLFAIHASPLLAMGPLEKPALGPYLYTWAHSILGLRAHRPPPSSSVSREFARRRSRSAGASPSSYWESCSEACLSG